MAIKNTKLSSFAKTKKGIIFSLIAISLLGVIMFTYSSFYDYEMSERFSVIEVRVDSMNKFLDDIEKNIDKAVYVAGFRSIIAMDEYVSQESTFITDLDGDFYELFTNGSINGTASVFMSNNTFEDWESRMDNIGQTVGINLSFSLESLEIYQDSPWSVIVAAKVIVTMRDVKGVAQWTKNVTVTPVISLDGFEDPLYNYYTGLGVSVQINKTPYDGDYVTGNDTSNLLDQLDKTYFTAWEGAPSFLMRLQNNLSASPYGIESFVNKTEVSFYYACGSGTSSVDYIYWSCNNSISTWNIKDMPSSFYLDNETDGSTRRLNKYQANGVII